MNTGGRTYYNQYRRIMPPISKLALIAPPGWPRGYVRRRLRAGPRCSGWKRGRTAEVDNGSRSGARITLSRLAAASRIRWSDLAGGWYRLGGPE